MQFTTAAKSLFIASLVCTAVHADIFRWDNGELIPGTEDVTPGPGVLLEGRELEYALLRGDLTGASFMASNLTLADLSESLLARANFNDAIVRGADFGSIERLTPEQLYSTASYKAGQLESICLALSEGPKWNLSGQNLAGSAVRGPGASQADFSGATIAGAQFPGASEQLYSTASYSARDLRGIRFANGSDLVGWDFTDQNLAGAQFGNPRRRELTSVANTDFTRANVNSADLPWVVFTGANLSEATIVGANLGNAVDLTRDQIESTSSFQAKDLRELDLRGNDLTDWDFSGQDLSNANLFGANLTGAVFNDAKLYGADLRDVVGFSPDESTDTRNTIVTPEDEDSECARGVASGLIEGLDVRAGEHMRLRARKQCTVVEDEIVISEGAVLEFEVLETIGFAQQLLSVGEEVPVTFGGTLRVTYDVPNPHLQTIRSGLTLFARGLDGETIAESTFSSFELPPGDWDVSQLPNNGRLILNSVYRNDGDFDVDGDLDIEDIDQLLNRVRTGRDQSYDVNRDNVLDSGDVAYWIHEIKKTWFGDANLDGEFNSRDLVAVFQAGHYEDGIDMNSGWAEGDWNGNGDFGSGDLIVAFQDGGYDVGPRMAAVPEPTSLAAFLFGLIGVVIMSNTRGNTI